MITVYGVGTIIGGGFYALVGKVAAESGMLTPIAILTAAIIALFSAFSYAELSGRFPYSAGEAHYLLAAFRTLWPSAIVGWAVIFTGVVSAATLADAFSGFLRTLIEIPSWLAVCGMVLSLGAIAAVGIRETAIVALVITIVELVGLVLVFVASADQLPTLADRWPELIPTLSLADSTAILLGAYLVFYAFIGFEDMVNVAEEVKRPRRNLPIAILASVTITGTLYFLVTLAMVLKVDQAALAKSDSPLSLVFAGGAGAVVITSIGLLAGLNGALIQIVMASRVAYGLAQNRQAPKLLGRVDTQTHTPLIATVLITGCVLVLALWLPIVSLAKLTSTVLLIVYALVNLSLIIVKRRRKRETPRGPVFSIWLPVVGFISCVSFVVFHAISVLF